jgi:lytic murein transglycosylase
MRVTIFTASLVVTVMAGASSPAIAAPPAPPPPPNDRNCQTKVPFARWIEDFRKDAIASGIKPQTIERAIGGMTPDQGIIGKDRKQGFFSQTFIDFYGKLATNNRLQNGREYVAKYRQIFDRAEKQYGVPGPVIAAFWALESDFGTGMGNLPVLRSLLTLAWDCRRGDMFREELKAALKIIERGDLRPEDMIGSWAGELGQTQFLPQHYYNYAVDYDGDGRRDLIHSIPDIIGSTANFISNLGWRRGEPWLEEVRVTKDLPWDQADLAVELPRSQWAQWGVTGVSGALPSDGLKASLMLPMGRNGPAFLAYSNFKVYLQWNQSLTYATTAAHLATRIAGAPALSRGNGQPIAALSYEQIKELQTILARRGFEIGEPDGKLGSGTRKAIKDVQKKMGFPADSYPTPELLDALRRRG